MYPGNLFSLLLEFDKILSMISFKVLFYGGEAEMMAECPSCSSGIPGWTFY